MANQVSLAQLPAASAPAAGGVVHAYDPTQPAGSRDVALALSSLAPSNSPTLTGTTTMSAVAMNATGGATDVGTVQVVRNANYSGGTAGWVNSAMQLRTEVGANPVTYENALTCIMNNHATAGENTSIFMQSNKFSTGPTWGVAIECREKVATNNPNTGTIGIELNVNSNGTDSLQQRRGIAIFSSCDNATGVQAETGYGVVFSNQPGDTNKGRFKTGIGFGSSGNPVDFDYGLDFTYATFNGGLGAAINMAAGQAIALAPGKTLSYTGSTLTYNTASGPALSIDDSGNATVSGTLTATKNTKVSTRNASGQSIPSGAATVVTGWSSSIDANAEFNASTGTFTAVAAGNYAVSGQLTFNGAMPVSTLMQIQLFANGANFVSGSAVVQNATSTTNVVALAPFIVSLSAGQTIQIKAYQASGSSVPLNAGASVNYLSIVRVP